MSQLWDRTGLFFSPENDVGGGDPDPEPDPDDPNLTDGEGDPDPDDGDPDPGDGDDGGDDDPDGSKAVSAATETYRTRLKGLGAIFDDKGEFLGWQASGITSQQTPTSQTPVDEDVDQKIARAVQPLTSERIINRVASANPNFVKYRREVETMLEANPNYPVSDASITGLFQYFRGQGTEMEIANAVAVEKAKGKKSSQKIVAGAAAASDTSVGSGNVPTTKNAKVTEEIAKKAKVWGIDPQKFANKVAAAKAAAKKENS